MQDNNTHTLRLLPKANPNVGGNTPPLFKPFSKRLAGLPSDYDKALLSLSIIDMSLQSNSQKGRGE